MRYPLAAAVLTLSAETVADHPATRGEELSPCVDNWNYKDDRGRTCKDLRREDCQRIGKVRYGEWKAAFSCCLCNQWRLSMPAAPLPRDLPEPLRHGEKCPVSRQLRYPHCQTLNLLPTDVSADGSVTCDFALGTGHNYFPSPRLMQCLEQDPPAEWRRDRARFLRIITALQHPKDCRKPFSNFRRGRAKWKWDSESVEFKHDPLGGDLNGPPSFHYLRLADWGVLSNIYHFSMMAAHHWDRGVPVLATKVQQRFYGEECGRGWSCFLSPLSNCTFEQVPLVHYQEYMDDWAYVRKEDLCGPHGLFIEAYGRCLCDEGYGVASGFGVPGMCGRAPDHRVHVPKNWTAYVQSPIMAYEQSSMAIGEKKWDLSRNDPCLAEEAADEFATVSPSLKERHGFMWWQGVSLWWLLRRAPARERLDQWMRREKLGADAVGVHIRYGDSCRDPLTEKVCYPVKHYMERAEAIVHTYGLSGQVYVASDDSSAIAAAARYVPRYGQKLRVVHQTTMDFSKYMKGKLVDLNHDLDQADTGAEVHRDLWAMAHCVAFVGTSASTWAQLVVELQAVRMGHWRPFSLLDRPMRDWKWWTDQPAKPPRPQHEYEYLSGEREIFGRHSHSRRS
eukprot:TRINITY_DN1640_c0_g1_i1.p1 TRINITY_DN1640_c0_g1~~TRINITY_DN1640_c0_g1_i1.p1  ORF type:complete len:647 (+),score=102.31 TRINITY_DN1640_c0_g1_i1:88-1941(+)